MRFNRTCAEDDWKSEKFQSILLNDLHLPQSCLTQRERKHWEWSMGMLALESYGYLRRDKRALGIACGHEPIMYALTNYLEHVTATDLYGETSFAYREASSGILEKPDAYCAFPYEKSRLTIQSMDARKLDFADNTFDILFSFSSIEHFGRSSHIRQAMREAFRVLKPGGIYILSVDYHFKTPWPQFPRFIRLREGGESLTLAEVRDLLIHAADFTVKEPPEFDVSEESIVNVYDFLSGQTSTGHVHPHIHLLFRKFALRPYLFTSLFLALFKPENA